MELAAWRTKLEHACKCTSGVQCDDVVVLPQTRRAVLIVALNSSAVGEGSVTVQLGGESQAQPNDTLPISSHVSISTLGLNNILGLSTGSGVTGLALAAESGPTTAR